MSLDLKNTNLHATGSAEGASSGTMWQSVSGSYQQADSGVSIVADESVNVLDTETALDHVKHQQIKRDIEQSQSTDSQTQYKNSLYEGIGEDVPLDPTKPTVLIVDDQQQTIDVYSRVFRESGYNAVSAVDGLDGLDKATKVHPELIFTGIIMPRMDGFAMVQALRKSATIAHTPVIMYSHLGRAQDRERARELDVRDFVVASNISPEDVVDRIHVILTRHEYTVPLDLSDPDLEKFVKELGGVQNVSCAQGQKHVLRLRVEDPADMTVSGRIECTDV